jgi:predicted ATPase
VPLPPPPPTTLAGPGGIGKTRLALEVASRELATHTDGVWFVDLSALSDPTLVPKAVASALGVREDPGRPLETVLLTTLGTKHLLLVIDNCEQLVEACAVLIEGLLRECPDVRVLATSRETLNLPGECVVRVPPLEVPDPARGATEISEVESVRLFLDRVRLNDPGYTPSASGSKAIATLCARLDGVPLALELAAARVRALTVEQILARLDDRFRVLEGSARGRPSRHQTLRATIDWSYELLEEDERVLFRRLAVFAGGWTLDAAEGVVGNDERGTMNDECQNSSVHRSEVLQHLERLVDKSLVIAEQRGTEARYRMLETIRHYAAEKLREAGETALVRGCHRDWFLGFAERFERERRVGDERVWLSRVEVEHDNLRAALEWSMTSSGEADTLLRLSCALGGFWTIRGYWNEARSWIDRALELSAEPASPLRAHGLYLTGNLARLEGDSARARDLLESSLSLYRANGENLGVGRVLRTLGLLLASEGDLDGAEAVTTEGLGVSREVDDLPEVATAANQLGVFATNRGDYERAESLHEQSLEIFRRLGPSRGLAAVKHNLGELARYRLDSARAVPLLEESLALSRYFDDRHGCLHTHLALGEIACYEGALGRADELFRTALAEASELGNPHLIGQCRLGLGHVARESGDEAAARSSYREVLATCAPPPTELLAEALEAFACMAGSQGDARRALRLEGAAAEVRDDVCVVLPPFGRRILDKHLDSARAALGPEEAARAFEAGRAMTTEQAIAYAMSVAGRR